MSDEMIYCSKCHRLAAQISRDDTAVKVIQRGKTMLALSAKSSSNDIGVNCPNGHKVKLKV